MKMIAFAASISVLFTCGTSVAFADDAPKPTLAAKLQPYIACINDFSESVHSSEARYRSWVGKSGPTGKERVIYGTYSISEPDRCVKGIAAANAIEPPVKDLEAAGAAYVDALKTAVQVVNLANSYYDQNDYKDDKMAKGKAMHPQLVAAWGAFDKADEVLRDQVRVLNDQVQREELTKLEAEHGKNGRYYRLAIMIKAKPVLQAELVDLPAKPDLARITPALTDLETLVTEMTQYAHDHDHEVDSSFVRAAGEYLKSAKELMRRIRDKTPYSSGDKMMLSTNGAGWMIEGSPPRVNRDYNQLVDAYNRPLPF